MQRTSELYRRLLADPGSVWEVRAAVAGEICGEEGIVSLATHKELFSGGSAGVGGAVCGEIDLTLYLDKGAPQPPRMARLCPACRLRGTDGTVSEWLEKGVFFVDARNAEDAAGGTLLTLHGFDAMRRTEQVWTPDQSLVFPMAMEAAAAEIARLMGTELDPRCRFRAEYFVDYPANDYTQRDVLRFIAAAHGGNWIITDTGLLLLVPLAEGTGDSLTLGREMGRLERGMTSPPIGKIVLLADEEHCYEAGSGSELEAACPYGSQAMADNLREMLEGYAYRPWEAEDALLDPASELGDLVEAGGEWGLLAQADTVFDGLMAASCGAPGGREMDSEYPYQSGPVRELERKIAGTRSLIEKNSREIRLAVESVEKEASRQMAEVRITVDSVSSTVQDASGRVSRLEQTVDGFDFTGFVTIKALSGGTTSIDGACIKTGTISADRIDVSKIKVDKIYATKYDRVAVSAGRSDFLSIGGDSDSNWNFDHVRIYAGQQLRIGSMSDFSSNLDLVLDTRSRVIRPGSSVTPWSIGTSAQPMGEYHGGKLYATEVYSGKLTTNCIFIGDTTIRPYFGSGKYYCGTADRPFSYGYFTELYINKTKFDPGDYAKTTALSSYAKASDLSGYAKTSDLSDYAKKTDLNGYAKASGIYQLFAGGTSTSYSLTYNSSRALVPSGTGQYSGSSLGSSASPFYWGYFTNLTVQGGSIALGTSSAKLGFFGAAAAARKSVSTCSTASSVAASTVASSLNALINALKGYGLIN